ncbi:hypothetical protein [Bacillus pumilus]|uniref:hypothetical protein n=1 Tax=Bacillus pumilus TaxID=1408 RepID=UPI0021B507BB|nr:hypothetical protein [Bacillus pumilus]
MLLFVIYCFLLFTNETTIFSVNSPSSAPDESPLTKKELNVLKKQDVVSKEITLDQLNHEHESQNDTIDLISTGDHLKDCDLQQNKQERVKSHTPYQYYA